MATEIQARAGAPSAPDGMPYELFVYLIYDEFEFSASGPGKITFEGSYYPVQYLPTSDKNVGWYLDQNYTKPATTTYIEDYILGMDVGNNYIFGGINLYGRLEENQVRFRYGTFAANKFVNGNSMQLAHKPGTIFMAAVGEGTREKAYLIFDDGTSFIDVVPRMVGLSNGGTGADLSTAKANSVFIKGSTGFGSVASAAGAFYSTGANKKPTFGTLPVSYGGTGATTFTKYGILYGDTTNAIKATAAGTAGDLLVSGGSSAAPSYSTPSLTVTVNSSTKLPDINFAVGGKTKTASIPAASSTATGVVTIAAQTFAGDKTFNNNVTVNGALTLAGGTDAYYDTSKNPADSKGALAVNGGITASKNLRVDGGTIQFAKEAKIKYDNTKQCFNFVF